MLKKYRTFQFKCKTVFQNFVFVIDMQNFLKIIKPFDFIISTHLQYMCIEGISNLRKMRRDESNRTERIGTDREGS